MSDAEPKNDLAHADLIRDLAHAREARRKSLRQSSALFGTVKRRDRQET